MWIVLLALSLSVIAGLYLYHHHPEPVTPIVAEQSSSDLMQRWDDTVAAALLKRMDGQEQEHLLTVELLSRVAHDAVNRENRAIEALVGVLAGNGLNPGQINEIVESIKEGKKQL